MRRKKGVSVDDLSFWLNGQAIAPHETPLMLELLDDDQIDAVVMRMTRRRLA
jgi:hypothetical protein